LGEDSEGYKKRFLDTIVPTFAHEYAHFEQGIRGRDFNRSDLSDITLGQGRQKGATRFTKPGQVNPKPIRHGKRGGYHRNSEKGIESYLRYIGSRHEVDAFASGAAAQIMQDMRQTYHPDEHQENEQITELRRSLADGYFGGWYAKYQQYFYDSLAGYIPGLRHDQMTKVWHRFLRLLYSKLGDYLHPTTGQASAYQATNFDPMWVRFAEKKTMPQMVNSLARQTALSLVNAKKEWEDAESIGKDVDRGWAGMEAGFQHGMPQRAEAFLRNYYYGQQTWEKEAHIDKLIDVYRRLVKKYVSFMLKDEEKNAMAAA
jgi:hypothetical protein